MYSLPQIEVPVLSYDIVQYKFSCWDSETSKSSVADFGKIFDIIRQEVVNGICPTTSYVEWEEEW